MQQAASAIKRGELTRARRIYEALVARNPDDSEALAGIGDVQRMQGDGAGAIASYKRALGVNPTYLPALLGVADTQWANGNRGAARASYKDIADRFPEGTYPSYVATRAEEPQAPAPIPAAPAAVAPAQPAPAAATTKKPWDPGDGI
jgi:tetratricopeptide (TPR) repeat protein